jgi:hypothetical protein
MESLLYKMKTLGKKLYDGIEEKLIEGGTYLEFYKFSMYGDQFIKGRIEYLTKLCETSPDKKVKEEAMDKLVTPLFIMKRFNDIYPLLTAEDSPEENKINRGIKFAYLLTRTAKYKPLRNLINMKNIPERVKEYAKERFGKAIDNAIRKYVKENDICRLFALSNDERIPEEKREKAKNMIPSVIRNIADEAIREYFRGDFYPLTQLLARVYKCPPITIPLEEKTRAVNIIIEKLRKKAKRYINKNGYHIKGKWVLKELEWFTKNKNVPEEAKRKAAEYYVGILAHPFWHYKVFPCPRGRVKVSDEVVTDISEPIELLWKKVEDEKFPARESAARALVDWYSGGSECWSLRGLDKCLNDPDFPEEVKEYAKEKAREVIRECVKEWIKGRRDIIRIEDSRITIDYDCSINVSPLLKEIAEEVMATELRNRKHV